MPSAQALIDTIQAAATNDAARQALLSDPRKVLDAAGVTLPASTKISVHVNDAKTFHAALPVEAPGTIEQVRALNPLAATVYEKAWRDPAYKAQLLSSPREAFISATGVTPPPSMKLIPHEDTASEVHIIVPYLTTSSELSDADLEHVAGGKGEAAVQQACSDAGGWSIAAMGAAMASTPWTGPVGAVAAIGAGFAAIGSRIGSAAK